MVLAKKYECLFRHFRLSTHLFYQVLLKPLLIKDLSKVRNPIY